MISLLIKDMDPDIDFEKEFRKIGKEGAKEAIKIAFEGIIPMDINDKETED